MAFWLQSSRLRLILTLRLGLLISQQMVASCGAVTRETEPAARLGTCGDGVPGGGCLGMRHSRVSVLSRVCSKQDFQGPQPALQENISAGLRRSESSRPSTGSASPAKSSALLISGTHPRERPGLAEADLTPCLKCRHPWSRESQ